MSEHSEKAERGHQPKSPDPGSPVPTPPAGEDVLDVISQFEAQLEGLKKVHVERRKSERDLIERQQAIVQHEQKLRQQFEQLKKDLEVVEQERATVREQQESLKARLGEIETRHSQVEAAEAELARKTSEFAAATKAFEQSRAETAERSSKLELRAQQLEQAEARLAAQAEKLGDRIQQLERQSSEAGRQAEEGARRAAEAIKGREQAEAAVESLRAELERVQQEALGLAERMQARDAEIADLTEKAEKLAEHSVALKAEADERRELLERVEQERAAIEQKAAQRVQALAEKLSQIEQSSGKAEEQAAATAGRVKELEERSKQLREQIASLESARKQESEAAGAKIAEMKAQLDEQSMEIAGRDQVIAELNAKLKVAADKLREFGELVQSQVVVGDDARAAEALTKAVALNDQLQHRAQQLQQRIDALEQQNKALKESAGRGGAGRSSGVVSDEATKLRRERLSRLRVAVREQARKVRRANALLQERFDQCEKLLSRRAELAAAHQAIQQQREKTASAKARGAAAGVMLATATTMGILLGLSWVIAEKVHPGEYAATCTIEAGFGERPSSEQELAEWQTYHEQLLDDPRFVETVADALKQRGMSTLAEPGALSAYLDSSLTVDSPGDGKLTMELRGQGATRTERVLDTLAVAMARTGNKTRSRRLDGATTVVSQSATAEKDALDQEQLMYAGGIFGGGFLLTSCLGAVVWRKMAASKSKFEHDQQLEALLAEARWTDPRISLDGTTAGEGAHE